jgi:hypothetical protein
VAEVRDLLAAAAEAVEEPASVPVDAVLAAGRRRVRRRRGTAGAGLAAAGVLLAALPLRPDDAPPAGPAAAAAPAPAGQAACGFSRAEVARGRPVDPAKDDFPTERAADLLALHGWPRAVPYDVTRWLVVTRGDAGLLVAAPPDGPRRYLPITRAAGRGWVAGLPCTPP